MHQHALAPVAIVTVLALLQYFYFAAMVGRARGRSGVKAPAMTGDPDFERHLRVQQNTLEQLMLFLPALWICGAYLSPLLAAGLGLVFVIGRFVYGRAYVADPARRGAGFIIGMLAVAILLLGGLGGALWSLI